MWGFLYADFALEDFFGRRRGGGGGRRRRRRGPPALKKSNNPTTERWGTTNNTCFCFFISPLGFCIVGFANNLCSDRQGDKHNQNMTWLAASNIQRACFFFPTVVDRHEEVSRESVRSGSNSAGLRPAPADGSDMRICPVAASHHAGGSAV